jgi:hypothetical protein
MLQPNANDSGYKQVLFLCFVTIRKIRNCAVTVFLGISFCRTLKLREELAVVNLVYIEEWCLLGCYAVWLL